ncbi:MAG: hypothetical protein K1X83_12865 [Oligoflexia bacterium]|nr:hypothetical protein [Oligoflexia bacterium]
MNSKKKRQDWQESLAIGKQGVADISKFLESKIVKQTWFDTYLVHNVEDEERYQDCDIDLLWVVPVQTFLQCRTIEVKTDRNRHTGNFFFETVSVEHRGRPGAFVITRAEWFFYYFITAGELYCFSTAELKPWFLKNEHEFPERRSHSDDNQRMFSWSTVGKIVPIERVMTEISHKKVFQNTESGWKAM